MAQRIFEYSMPRGGARPGSGPKPGIRNQETAKLLQQAAEDGVLPLQIMFDNVRFYTKGAYELIGKLLGGQMPAGGEGEDQATIIEAIGQVLRLRELAGAEAARAAPYCHPRQGYVAEEGGSDVEVPLAVRLAEYQRRDDIEASAGKVVDFKPPGLNL